MCVCCVAAKDFGICDRVDLRACVFKQLPSNDNKSVRLNSLGNVASYVFKFVRIEAAAVVAMSLFGEESGKRGTCVFKQLPC